MNRTHFEHAAFAIVIQLLFWPLVGLAAGALIAFMFLAGREYAQAEYKVRDKTGKSLTDMMPWHVFRKGYWSLDAFLDLLIPVCFMLLIIGLEKI